MGFKEDMLAAYQTAMIKCAKDKIPEGNQPAFEKFVRDRVTLEHMVFSQDGNTIDTSATKDRVISMIDKHNNIIKQGQGMSPITSSVAFEINADFFSGITEVLTNHLKESVDNATNATNANDAMDLLNRMRPLPEGSTEKLASNEFGTFINNSKWDEIGWSPNVFNKLGKCPKGVASIRQKWNEHKDNPELMFSACKVEALRRPVKTGLRNQDITGSFYGILLSSLSFREVMDKVYANQDLSSTFELISTPRSNAR